MKEGKIQLLHPVGKKAFRIDKDKYEIMSKAILRSVKKSPLTHTQMFDTIVADFKKRNILFDGSIEWYMEGVKLDLEATKHIERLFAKPPHKWGILRKHERGESN